MQERFDTERMIERAQDMMDDIRRSDAYPAIIGGIAGGIAGALMATIIASRYSTPRSEAPPPSSSSNSRSSLPMRDMVALVGVLAGLVKQAREWYYQERGKR